MSAIAITTTELLTQRSHCGFELPAGDFQDLLPAPPINLDQLREQCMGDLDFALMLLDEFEKTSQSRLDAFDAVLFEQNHSALTSKAHALKGVAGILGASALMEICENLESQSSDTDWNQTRDLIEQLYHEYQRTIAFIPTVRAMRFPPLTLHGFSTSNLCR